MGFDVSERPAESDRPKCEKHGDWSWHEWPPDAKVGDKCLCGEVELEYKDINHCLIYKEMFPAEK